MIRRIWVGVGLSVLALMGWAAITILAAATFSVTTKDPSGYILVDDVFDLYRVTLNGEITVTDTNRSGNITYVFSYNPKLKPNAVVATPSQTYPKNSTNPKVSQDLSNLSCGTVYEVQLVGNDTSITDPNVNAIDRGAKVEFTTPACKTFDVATESATDTNAVYDPGLDLYSATLWGRISVLGTDHKGAVNFHFVYGVKGDNSSFKNAAPDISFSRNSTNATKVFQKATGLRCDTTYQFHIVGTNADPALNQTRIGQDLEFTTPKCSMATITDEKLDPIGDHFATFYAKVNAFGRAAKAKVEWGEPNQAGGFITGTDMKVDNIAVPAGKAVHSIMVPIAGLACNKVYLVKSTLTQVDSSGTVFLAPGTRFKTAACVPPPAIVFNATGIQRVTATSAVFSASTILHVLSGAAGFEYHANVANASWIPLPEQKLTLASGKEEESQKVIFHVGTLLCEKSYTVRFFAATVNGRTVTDPPLTFTTGACGGKDLLTRATAAGKLVAGGSHALLIRSDDTISAWGDNTRGQLGIDAKTWWMQEVLDANGQLLTAVTHVSAGAASSAAVTGGFAYTWGANDAGQLGRGTTTDPMEPVQVVMYDALDNTLSCQQEQLCNVTKVVMGESHALALNAQLNTKVYAWGRNSNGQLGDGTFDAHSLARTVWGSDLKPSLGGEVADIAVGARFSLALMRDSRVMAWGANDLGQLGDLQMEMSRTNADEVIGLKGVIAIAAGRAHALALVEAEKGIGTVMAWGSNDSGQLGLDKVRFQDPYQKSIQAVTDPQNVILNTIVAIAAGADHSLALQDNGQVLAWGGNSRGQLGDGTAETRNQPIKVKIDSENELTSVVAIAAGDFYSLALLNDGTVYGWGDNRHAQLGGLRGTSSVYATPVLSPSGTMNLLTDPKMVVSAHIFTLGGGKNAGKLTVALPEEPADRVVVDILLDGDLKLMTPNALEFDQANWNRPQTIEFSLTKFDGASGVGFLKLAAGGYEPLSLPVVIERTAPVDNAAKSAKGAWGWDLALLILVAMGAAWTRRRAR